MSTTLMERLNAIIETGEVSRAALARAAGLHPNSLRKLGSDDWNPTADTLVRLEKLIQRGTTEVLVGTEAIIDEARNGRMMLGGVYASTLLVWLDDQTDGWAETASFLDRRIDDVMKIEKLKADWKGQEHFSVSRFLGRLRYPAR